MATRLQKSILAKLPGLNEWDERCLKYFLSLNGQLVSLREGWCAYSHHAEPFKMLAPGVVALPGRKKVGDSKKYLGEHLTPGELYLYILGKAENGSKLHRGAMLYVQAYRTPRK